MPLTPNPGIFLANPGVAIARRGVGRWRNFFERMFLLGGGVAGIRLGGGRGGMGGMV